MAETLINKTQAGEGIWTQDNLVAGENISITQVEKPVIDANTLGVWHFDGNANNAVSGSNITFSTIPTTFSTSISKFNESCTVTGPGSNYINNTGLGTGDFTIDVWYYFNNYLNSSPRLGINNTSVYIERDYQTSTSTTSVWLMRVGNSYINNLFSFQQGTWNHIALERHNMVLNAYLNGVLCGSKQLDSAYNADSLQWGCKEGQDYWDELRISNVARYQGQNFTPNTEPYAPAGGPAQYQINNTKADPDLSSYLQNTATMNTSLTVAGVATTSDRNTNIGKSSAAYGAYCTVIGNNAKSGVAGNECDNSTLVGANTSATGGGHNVVIGYAAQTKCPTWGRGIAIGDFAIVSADYAVQIGTGFNSTEDTFQVFNTTVVDSNGKIPTASLEADLTTKADTDLGNVPSSKGILVESYVNGTSWYRVYSDGWCEQGGSITTSNGTIVFLKEFIDTNYTFISQASDIDDYAITVSSWGNKTKSSIQVVCGYNGNAFSREVSWQACGYIS